MVSIVFNQNYFRSLWVNLDDFYSQYTMWEMHDTWKLKSADTRVFPATAVGLIPLFQRTIYQWNASFDRFRGISVHRSPVQADSASRVVGYFRFHCLH